MKKNRNQNQIHGVPDTIKFSPTFVPVFLGMGYNPVVSILYIFMPMVVVLGFSVYLDGMYLIPSGRKHQSSFAVIAGSGTNLCLLIKLQYNNV